MKRQKMRFVGLMGMVVAAVVPMLSLGVDSESELPPGNLSVGGRFTDFVQEFNVDALVPAWYREWGPDAGLVFFNPRGTFEESAEQELNLGLGYRHLWGDAGVIGGVNAYYDGRWTRHDNRFDQLGLGAELLTEWVDARFNYYLPEDDRKEIDEFDEVTVSRSSGRCVSPPFVARGRILRVTRRSTTTTTTTRHFVQYETAREGYDVELGVKLPRLPDWCEVRVFGGYYDFESTFHDTDAEGLRARLEIRTVPALILDAEVFEDKDLNGADFLVGARIQMPFELAQLVRGGNPSSGAKGKWRAVERQFRDRLTERVMRDTHVRLEESDVGEEGQTSSKQFSSQLGVQNLGPAPQPPKKKKKEPVEADEYVLVGEQ